MSKVLQPQSPKKTENICDGPILDSLSADRFMCLIGNWKGSVPIPEQSFETREWRLEGDDHILLIKFLRKMLRWIPEERPTGVELAYDDFLMQAVAEELAQKQKTSESDG